MEIDTGASVSVLSSATYREKFSGKPLQASSVALRAYAEEPLKNLGSLTVEEEHNSQKMELPLIHRFWPKPVGERLARETQHRLEISASHNSYRSE
jgi:hypothetical protein